MSDLHHRRETEGPRARRGCPSTGRLPLTMTPAARRTDRAEVVQALIRMAMRELQGTQLRELCHPAATDSVGKKADAI